jgi:hypothetical protein
LKDAKKDLVVEKKKDLVVEKKIFGRRRWKVRFKIS